MTDFKPGDRVRLTEPYGGYPTGREGIVKPNPRWFRFADPDSENLINVLLDGRDDAFGIYARRVEKVPVISKVDELTAENAKLKRDLAAADISYRSLERETNRLSQEVADKDFLIESRGRTIDNLRSALSKRNQEAADLKRRLSEADRTVTALQAAIDDFDQAKAGIQVGDLIHITNAGAQMALQTYRAIAVAGGKPTRVRFTGYDGSTAQENRNNDGRKSQRWVNDYTWEKVSS